MKKIVTAILVVALMLSGLVMLVIRQARQGKTTVPVSNKTASYVRLQQPEMFTYQELVTLGTTDKVSGTLGDKLQPSQQRPSSATRPIIAVPSRIARC